MSKNISVGIEKVKITGASVATFKGQNGESTYISLKMEKVESNAPTDMVEENNDDLDLLGSLVKSDDNNSFPIWFPNMTDNSGNPLLNIKKVPVTGEEQCSKFTTYLSHILTPFFGNQTSKKLGKEFNPLVLSNVDTTSDISRKEQIQLILKNFYENSLTEAMTLIANGFVDAINESVSSGKVLYVKFLRKSQKDNSPTLPPISEILNSFVEEAVGNTPTTLKYNNYEKGLDKDGKPKTDDKSYDKSSPFSYQSTAFSEEEIEEAKARIEGVFEN